MAKVRTAGSCPVCRSSPGSAAKPLRSKDRRSNLGPPSFTSSPGTGGRHAQHRIHGAPVTTPPNTDDPADLLAALNVHAETGDHGGYAADGTDNGGATGNHHHQQRRGPLAR